MHRVCALVAGAALLLCPTAARSQRKFQSFDPGHRSDVAVGGLRVSCPNGFTSVSGKTAAECAVLRHDRFKLALFVAPEKAQGARASLAGLLGTILKSGVAEEASAYRWKQFAAHPKQSKYETDGATLQGYDGKTLLGLAYRELTVGGKRVLIGYVFDLHGGADGRQLFEQDLEGDSILGSLAETHVVCSITGERYDDLNPNRGGIASSGERSHHGIENPRTRRLVRSVYIRPLSGVSADDRSQVHPMPPL